MAKVEGLERLKARFARLPKRMRVAVRVSLDQSADELVAFQRRLVPVDDGDLRDSIHKRAGRHELAIAVVAGGDRAHYARFVEFGTVKAPASPFFYVAYRTNRKRIKGRTARAVSKAVKAG